MSEELAIKLRINAAKAFRSKYKEIKKSLDLNDFVMYAIIRGLNPESTIKDSNYKEDVDPIKIHKKYTESYFGLHLITEKVNESLQLKYKHPYLNSSFFDSSNKASKIARMKYLFGLSEEEIFMLFDYYFEEKAE